MVNSLITKQDGQSNKQRIFAMCGLPSTVLYNVLLVQLIIEKKKLGHVFAYCDHAEVTGTNINPRIVPGCVGTVTSPFGRLVPKFPKGIVKDKLLLSLLFSL